MTSLLYFPATKCVLYKVANLSIYLKRYFYTQSSEHAHWIAASHATLGLLSERHRLHLSLLGNLDEFRIALQLELLD